MTPTTILYKRLPSGAVRAWIEGHAACCITANSQTEAEGLLVEHYQEQLGIKVKEFKECPLKSSLS